MYTCGWFMLLYGRNQHNTVKQLFPNWGKKKWKLQIKSQHVFTAFFWWKQLMGTIQIPKLLLTNSFLKSFSPLYYLNSNQISFPWTKDSEVREVLRIGSWKWGMRRGIATFLPIVLPFTKEIHWPGCHNTLVSQHSCICPWDRQKMLNSKDICHSKNLCSIFNNQIFLIYGENRPKL